MFFYVDSVYWKIFAILFKCIYFMYFDIKTPCFNNKTFKIQKSNNCHTGQTVAPYKVNWKKNLMTRISVILWILFQKIYDATNRLWSIDNSPSIDRQTIDIGRLFADDFLINCHRSTYHATIVSRLIPDDQASVSRHSHENSTQKVNRLSGLSIICRIFKRKKTL